ncbi:MAG TPA: Slp family lipoprotein [Thermodesulfobacteriota bacterium]|nr:Slp family lipoprotein [Thermodesulfobacteriota bacterium]
MFPYMKVFFSLLLACTLAACAYPISKQFREEARKDATFPAVFQNPSAYSGSVVIWGGEIIEVTNTREGTEMIMLETPLNYTEEPRGPRYSQGRFIARTNEFLDPSVYKAGRKVTLAGQVVGEETRRVGQADYRYPVIRMLQVVLWTERS